MVVNAVAPGKAPPRWVVASALGVAQIAAYGSTYYLPAVLAKPTAAVMGWPLAWVVGAFSVGLLVGGVVSPAMGRAVDRYGGRPVLAASAALIALGLVIVGLAPNLIVYFVAWIIIGLGMGAGLYEAAFATLGALYGQEARLPITAVTLFGGFASTICWPLSAFLLEAVGWQWACFTYAAFQAGLIMPLYLLAIPRSEKRELRADLAVPAVPGTTCGLRDGQREHRPFTFALLAAVLTIGPMLMGVISVHLFTILEARQIGLAGAVALGALIGPSQVGARMVELAIGRRFHPLWTLIASTSLMAAGMVVLWAGLPMVAVGLVFYGAGMGIESIARGTVPLALFGAAGYPTTMGRLAMPGLIAQALAPAAAALLLDWLGLNSVLVVLMGLGVLNVGFAVLLLRLNRH